MGGCGIGKAPFERQNSLLAKEILRSRGLPVCRLSAPSCIKAEGVEVLDHRVERGEAGGEGASPNPGEKGPVGAEREGEVVVKGGEGDRESGGAADPGSPGDGPIRGRRVGERAEQERLGLHEALDRAGFGSPLPVIRLPANGAGIVQLGFVEPDL
jgi:hypothetical protein